MQACLFLASAIAIGIICPASALKCLVADGLAQAPTSTPCASFHTGCYEQLRLADDLETMEYKAQCAKGDECNDAKPEDCQVCSGSDDCNDDLLKQAKKQYMQCYSYNGKIKQVVFENEVKFIAQVKEQPAFCKTSRQCHRVQITKPDPDYKSGYSTTPNKMSIFGGCNKIDCRPMQHVSECLTCSGPLCNDLSVRAPSIAIAADESSGADRDRAGLLPVAVGAAAVAAAVVSLRQRG